MTPELYNRIEDELREYLHREPTIGEVMNSQNDHLIMYRVDKRISAEEKGLMQDHIDSLEKKIDKVKKTVDTSISKVVG